jgi:3-isopropylmalate/(R)-2-methylmalate dehydratase large subunit
VGVSESIPADADPEALAYMGSRRRPHPRDPDHVAFIGSCTNGRLSDIEEAARTCAARWPHVKALMVPGSQTSRARRKKAAHRVLSTPGSGGRRLLRCLAMNPDKLETPGLRVVLSELRAAGSPRAGRADEPAMVAAAAIAASRGRSHDAAAVPA